MLSISFPIQFRYVISKTSLILIKNIPINKATNAPNTIRVPIQNPPHRRWLRWKILPPYKTRRRYLHRIFPPNHRHRLQTPKIRPRREQNKSLILGHRRPIKIPKSDQPVLQKRLWDPPHLRPHQPTLLPQSQKLGKVNWPTLFNNFCQISDRE